MPKNSFAIALRRLLRQRQSTALNLLGLSTGLAATILIFTWITDERNVDSYTGNGVYQILLNTPSSDNHEIKTADYTPGYLATTLKAEFPEVESAAALVPSPWHGNKFILSAGDHALSTDGAFITGNFFDLFPMAITQGDKQHLLKDRNDIVISSDLAQNLFGKTDNLIGKTVEWNAPNYQSIYRITGVFQKPPAGSTLQFDLAFNYDLFLDHNQKLLDWRNNDPSTFVLLKKGADVARFNNKIATLIKNKNPKARSSLFAQRYSERYLHGVYENGRPAGGRIQYVRLFSLIAAFILLIAAINFMNLSTAKAAGRIKEAGIKKVIGASRLSLILQHLGESLLLTTIAVLLAIGLAALALPQFGQLTGKSLQLPFDGLAISALIIITLTTGLLAGSYPALYLSGFKPAASLAGKVPDSINEIFIRKGLVILQFSLSTLFIVGVLVVYRQMNLVQTKNLGYNRNNLLYFHPAFEASLPDLVQAVRNTPGVLEAANFGQNITNRDGGTTDISWPGKDPNNTQAFTDLSIGPHFLETIQIKLKAGRTFSEQYGNEKEAVIFNQAAIDLMGLKDPIGKTVHLWGIDRRIIGVVDNFHFQSLHEAIKPCFFEYNTGNFASNIMVRIAPGAERSTIDRLAQLYKAKSGGLALEYTFLDEDYRRLYAAETRVAILARYFAALAVIISGLGLFGLAAYTAQKRQKEIGIRKVIGAGVSNIVGLLSREFFLLAGLALLIAFPAAAWLMTRWLHGFAYRVSLTADVFLWTAAATGFITAISIGWQCLKAAWVNPISAIRSE